MTFVADLTWKLFASVPLNLTAVAPAKPKPLIVTAVPTGPLGGLTFVIEVVDGGTVKPPGLRADPAAVVTTIAPVVAPAGTVATSQVSQRTENVAGTPLNVTDVAPARYVPWIATLVPTAPDPGERLVTVGVLW